MRRLRNTALEEAILLRPDDPEVYLVYADWMQQQGDPRGELIVIQHALSKAPAKDRAELLAREAALLEKHRSELTVPGLTATWGFGFYRSVTTMPNLFGRKALAHASSRFVRAVQLGHVYGHSVKATLAPLLALDSLVLRDVIELKLAGIPEVRLLEVHTARQAAWVDGLQRRAWTKLERLRLVIQGSEPVDLPIRRG